MAPVDILSELLDEHAAQRPALDRLDAYFRTGYYDTLDVPANARAEYRNLIESAVTNWLGLVVETTAERLIVDGFRTPGADDADGELWQWWQANHLDGRQMQLNTAASRDGVAFVSVWPGDDGAAPVIVPESARSVHVRYDDVDPSTATAAVKARGSAAWLYLPDTVTRYRSTGQYGGGKWIVEEQLDNPLGVVPFVRFRCNADLDGGYASDLDVAIPVQNRITETTVDRCLASRLSAFRQRYATGLDIEVDEETGDAVAPFNAAVDRVWISEDPDVKFGEFAEATLSNYIGAVAADVHHLAAVTRTPAHYLLGQMVNLSAEALAAAETGLARKVQERQQTFGEAWESVARLAQTAAGREATDDVETVWRRTETVSDAQVVDAALKLAGLKVPTEALWERVGATPQQIKQWRRMSRGDAITAALAAPLVNEGAAEVEDA